MRRFRLIRTYDITGKSGTGFVAEGVEFTDGRAVTRWCAETAQTCVWDSVADLLSVHGHDGATTVQFIDPPVARRAFVPRPEAWERGHT